jgi:hypothetical protein
LSFYEGAEVGDLKPKESEAFCTDSTALTVTSLSSFTNREFISPSSTRLVAIF